MTPEVALAEVFGRELSRRRRCLELPSLGNGKWTVDMKEDEKKRRKKKKTIGAFFPVDRDSSPYPSSPYP